ncbi:hypothetical protein GC163_22525 [bacterium]|nr:hypothetical protein [bacterium]
MIHVAELNHPKQLEEFRVLWRSLLERTPGATLLQSREVLEEYARQHRDEVSLKVLVVHVGWQPVGILPLVRRSIPSRLGTLRALTFPTWDRLECCGPIGPNVTATLLGAFQYLAAAPRDWDVIDLRGIDDPRRDRGRTRNALQIAGLAATVRNWSTTATFQPAAQPLSEQYRFRSQLKTWERQLWKHGPWDHEHLMGDELSSSQAFEACWASFQDLMPTEERLPCHDLAWAAARSEWLSCQTIRMHGRVVGCLLSTLIGKTLQPLHLAVKPGLTGITDVLFGRLLYDEFCSARPEYQFGSAWVPYAVPWGATTQPTQRYTHFSAYRPKAQLLRMAQWIKPERESVSAVAQPIYPTPESSTLPIERRQLRLAGSDYLQNSIASR